MEGAYYQEERTKVDMSGGEGQGCRRTCPRAGQQKARRSTQAGGGWHCQEDSAKKQRHLAPQPVSSRSANHCILRMLLSFLSHQGSTYQGCVPEQLTHVVSLSLIFHQ